MHGPRMKPCPTPTKMNIVTQMAVGVVASKRISNPVAAVVRSHPIQIAHRNRPVLVIIIPHTAVAGRMPHVIGSIPTPVRTGEKFLTLSRKSGP